MNTYKYQLQYQYTDPNGGKKIKERACEVRIPVKNWTRGLYEKLEKWLQNQEGGGDVTIIDVMEA